MSKKWIDPLDRLLEADQKARTVHEYLAEEKTNKEKNAEAENVHDMGNNTKIFEISTSKIVRWEHKDRPENELGDLKDLAESLKIIGQQQPCILRPSTKLPNKFELIAGERRWRAAEIAGIKVLAIVKDLDDRTAALIQATENEKRSDLSDFAKGMSFADKIEKGLFSQADLIEILGMKQQQINRLLSFSRIPSALFKAIGDFSQVSARTAEELARLSKKGEEYLTALISLADKIRSGKFGHKSINSELEKKISVANTKINSNQKIYNVDGRHLFTWRLDNNAAPSIHFPKDIIKLINGNLIDLQEITLDIKDCIAKKLTGIQIQEKPPGGFSIEE